MHNELRFADWIVDKVGPIGDDWIEKLWLPKARQLLAENHNTWTAKLPSDHEERMNRALLSLDGLSIGDALGEALCYRSENAPVRLRNNDLPGGPWFHTDDTEMAISLVSTLRSHGHVDPETLSRKFARRFERDPDRGYGRMTRIQLREILAGAKWQVTAANAFGGQGSMGNGGAMRVAPLGAYYTDDLPRLVAEARVSSKVTHTHPEGIAGTIAVAIAAAMAWRLKDQPGTGRSKLFFDQILNSTPESEVKRGIALVSKMPSSGGPVPGRSAHDVARAVGCGELVTAPDTVPFCIWSAAHHLDDYVTALSETIRVGGDCDTNAAIVGGIVALSAGPESIPPAWMAAKEPFNV
jgi:ADP-ribosylglycohydrolase